MADEGRTPTPPLNVYTPGRGRSMQQYLDAQEGRSATRCEQDCTIKEWPHAGPCEVQRYMDAPGRVPSSERQEYAIMNGNLVVSGPTFDRDGIVGLFSRLSPGHGATLMERTVVVGPWREA